MENTQPTEKSQLEAIQQSMQELLASIDAELSVLQQCSLRSTVVQYEQSIAQEPHRAFQIYQELGYCFVKQERFEAAEHIFNTLFEQSPQHRSILVSMAWIAMGEKDWALAKIRWNKVLALSPDFVPAMLALGTALMQLKQYEEAKIVYQRFVEQHPNRPEGYEKLSHIARSARQWEAALAQLNSSIQQTEASSSYLQKAQLLVSSARYQEGFAAIDICLEKTEKKEDTLILKADLLFKASRFAEAADILSVFSNQDPTNSHIHVSLIQALIGAKRFHEADRLISELPDYPIKLPDSDIHDPKRIIALLKIWQRYYGMGIDLDRPKIFGIGLSRTGTTTLTEALIRLGYGAIHFINPITQRLIDLDDIHYFDAFTDSPIAFRFEALYFLFPNAKFIYTERKIADWMASNIKMYAEFSISTPQDLKVHLSRLQQPDHWERQPFKLHPIYRYAYESLYASHTTWEDAYRAFDQRVNYFFKNKSADKLLKLNICDGDRWEKLCDFLGVPIPADPFPYYNKDTTDGRPAVLD